MFFFSDLISKGFPAGKTEYEIEGGSSDAVKFKVTGAHQGQVFDSLLETTKIVAERGVTLKATAKTDKAVPEYCLEASAEPSRVPGLKATFTTTCKTPAEGDVETQKVSAVYKREAFTLEESVSYEKQTVKYDTSLVFAYQAARVGVRALASLPVASADGLKPKLDEYAVKVGYVPTKELALIAKFEATEKKGKPSRLAAASIYYKKDKYDLAASAAIELAEQKEGATKIPSFTVAASYAVDPSTAAKVKVISGTQEASFAIKHQLTTSLSVTVASAISLKDQSQHTHGLGVNLKL